MAHSACRKREREGKINRMIDMLFTYPLPPFPCLSLFPRGAALVLARRLFLRFLCAGAGGLPLLTFAPSSSRLPSPPAHTRTHNTHTRVVLHPSVVILLSLSLSAVPFRFRPPLRRQPSSPSRSLCASEQSQWPLPPPTEKRRGGSRSRASRSFLPPSLHTAHIMAAPAHLGAQAVANDWQLLRYGAAAAGGIPACDQCRSIGEDLKSLPSNCGHRFCPKCRATPDGSAYSDTRHSAGWPPLSRLRALVTLWPF
jgi:hypothetical protein